MSISTFDTDVNIISKLDDYPNDIGGLSATQLKAKFDEAAGLLKTYINTVLIPAIIAGNIPFESSTAIPANTLQAAVENVQQQISEAVTGSIPNNTIGMDKLTATVQAALTAGSSAANAVPDLQEATERAAQGVTENAAAISALQEADEQQDEEIAKIGNKAEKSTSATFVLLASGWSSDKRQTITMQIGDGRNGAVGMDTAATAEQWQEAAKCEVRLYSTNQTGMTFSCTSIPTLDLPCAYILI